MRYSWSKFGREAEYVIALYLKSIGWRDVQLSPGSRGAADITASCPGGSWFIQVKASSAIPRLKGCEVRRLKELAKSRGGLAVVSTLQPFRSGAFVTGEYAVTFYDIDSWLTLDPTAFVRNKDVVSLRSEAQGPLQGRIHRHAGHKGLS